MKKTFIALLAIASMAACNKADVVSVVEGDLISFGNAFVDNATKATDPSYSSKDIEKFNVYGTVNDVLIYPGTEITKTEYNEAWTCPVEQYWIPGANYKFVGIVDGNVTDGSNVISKTNLENGMPVSITYKADGKTDLLCQTITKSANTNGTPNGLVKFNYTHLLSKVNFKVVNKSTQAAGYSFVVKNIKCKGYTGATYDVNNEKWTSPTDGNIPFENITVAAGVASSELTTEVLLLPATVEVSFTVDILYDGNLVTSTNYSEYSHPLVIANSYNFIIEVSVGEKIEFTVEKQPEWTNGNTVDTNSDSVKDAVVL